MTQESVLKTTKKISPIGLTNTLFLFALFKYQPSQAFLDKALEIFNKEPQLSGERHCTLLWSLTQLDFYDE